MANKLFTWQATAFLDGAKGMAEQHAGCVEFPRMTMKNRRENRNSQWEQTFMFDGVAMDKVELTKALLKAYGDDVHPYLPKGKSNEGK